MNRHCPRLSLRCMEEIICLKIKESLDNLKADPHLFVSDGKEEKKLRKALIRVHNFYSPPVDHILEENA